MERTSFADMRCSLARTLEKIGDWWTPLILRDLFLGVARFDALVEDLGLSRNLLTTRLKSLERHGIISRRAYQQKPVRHEYVLTEAGRDLVPILLALTAWGDRWAPPPEGAPLKFRHKGCGEIFEARITCSSCGEFDNGRGRRGFARTWRGGGARHENRRATCRRATTARAGSTLTAPAC